MQDSTHVVQPSCTQGRLRSDNIPKGWAKDRLRSELMKALDILNIHQDREEECVVMLKLALEEIKGLKQAQDSMKQEIQDLKAKNGTFEQQLSEATEGSIKSQVETVTKECTTVVAAVAHQQRALEQLESLDRQRNLVFTGVAENKGGKEWEKDQADIEDILVEIQCPGVIPAKVMRLGKPREGGAPPRPLLVITNSITEAKIVLENAKRLKGSPKEDRKRVYIKRDQHPAILKEWKRLRDFARVEREAPVNVHCNIKVDYKKRAVTKDGEVICQFVSPFQRGLEVVPNT